MKNKYQLELLIFFLSIIAFDCSRTVIEGVFVCEKDATNYLEIKSNGKVFIRNGNDELIGDYEIEPNGILLLLGGNKVLRMQRNGDTLLNKGTKWIYWKLGSGVDYESKIPEIQKRIIYEKEVKESRDLIIEDLTQYALKAQYYYSRPQSLGGGSMSFKELNTTKNGISLLLTDNLSDNENGRYTIIQSSSKDTVIIGVIGKILLNDGTHPQYSCVVTTQNYRIDKIR